METREELVRRLRGEIGEVSPQAIDTGACVLIDVREAHEHRAGHIAEALHVPLGELGERAADLLPNKRAPIVAHCASGVRSLFAADTLKRLGYTDVRSMSGGFNAWRKAGLPVEESSILDPAERRRYARHVSIPEVGELGQRRLLESRVLIVGAGGLGSPAAMYLAAAGAGTIGLVDFDEVEESNLQRQLLHTSDRVGLLKVESAQRTLAALNPGVKVEPHALRLDAANARQIISSYEIVLDGSDNFETRFLINDTCAALGIPNVHGSIFRFEGQVAVFWPPHGPCYRCLYAEAPPAGTVPT